MCDKILLELKNAREKLNDDYCSQNATEIERKRDETQDVTGYKESLAAWPAVLSTWCPRASIYYAYTEDINPFDRIDKFTKFGWKSFEDHAFCPHFDPPLDPFTIRDPYNENEAKEKYLRSEPVSFAIFGKPGINSHELAKLLSDWWKCILISPESVVHEEIEKQTDKGKWIEDILDNRGTIEQNVIMNLVETRIGKRDVMHRGYVVEGLPLIPNHPDPEYSTCPENIDNEDQPTTCCTAESTCRVEAESCSSKSTLNLSNDTSSSSFSPLNKFDNTGNYLNLSKNSKRSSSFDSFSFFKKPANIMGTRMNLFRRTTVRESLPIDKDKPKMRILIDPFDDETHGTKYDRCADYIPNQIDRIFNEWPVKPTIIIYIICPDDDVIQRRVDFISNPLVGESADKIFTGTDATGFNKKHLEDVVSKRGNSAEETVKVKCEIYKRYALPVIDRFVLMHNPQNVIRVDGRMLVAQMFQIVNTKLRTLPYSRAVIPKRIGSRIGWETDDSLEGEGDEEVFEKSEVVDDNFEGRSNEEIFENLSGKYTISSRFRWSLSKWKFTCPVELAQGRTTEGKADHAVRFMNNIFFLSSLGAMDLFLENPRPFLLPMRPRPNCKIAVFGPSYSGKSELSNNIARYFNANVVNVRELEKGIIEDRIDAKVADAVREALGRVIAELTKTLEGERQSRELERHEALNFWISEVKQLFKELDRMHQSKVFENNDDPDFTILQQKLKKYGLEILLEDFSLFERMKNNRKLLCYYVPENLRCEEPPIRELTEHDPEVAIILENEVRHLRNEKIAVTSLDMAGLLVSRIKMMPDVPIDNELSREPGWIIDGMYPDPEIWRVLMEAGVAIDDLILLVEKDPYKNLINKWKRYNNTDDIVEDDENEDEGDLRSDVQMEKYITDIHNFEEKWENFRKILENTGKHPIICYVDGTSNPFEVVSKHINDRFYLPAKIVTERESDDEDAIESVTDIDEEEEIEDEEPGKLKQVEKDNRWLGDTNIYCPVLLARHKVLCKGKTEYSAMYLDKIYICSSAEALADFVKNPEEFNVPFMKPMTKLPLTRICIVGTSGSGKSTVAKTVAEQFNVTYIDFADRLNAYMRDRGGNPDDINDKKRLNATDPADQKYYDDKDTILAFVRKYKNEGATLPQKMLDECYLQFYRFPYDTSAVIFDAFPNCLEDVEAALKNYAIPELVIQLECNLEKMQERLLPRLLQAFMKTPTDYKDAEKGKEGEETEADYEEDKDDPEQIKEAILQEIEESYNRTKELLANARHRMEEESVPWIKLSSDRDSYSLLSTLRKIIHPLIFRKSSTLERTYDVNPGIAEDLLECGYFFLSSFGRTCPVQMYKDKYPIQMYLPLDDQDKIYTILHRQYVYFIAGEESVELFTNDPLKYLRQDSCGPVIPLKISIIGPPKCGKSTVAQRFSKAYGMRVITRENALRWTKLNYSWTKTGSIIERSSQSREELTNQIVARSIELYLMDPISSSQGYVLDGFPTNREEAEELALLNIRPMIVLNLQADENFCLTSSTINKQERNSIDYYPSLITNRYDSWIENSPIFLDWLHEIAQNVVDIDAARSKWAVWRCAEAEVCSRFADIKRYFREADYDKVHTLKNLSVSPIEFKSRQGPHESYCPVCLHYEESLRFSSTPPDRRGVVQFREYFYWICPRHFQIFIDNPQACLPPQSAALLPLERPQIVDETIDLKDASWAGRLRAGGNCIVTYANSLPEYKLVPGQPNIGVLYENHLYLFCSLECREKFCSRPLWYSKTKIEYRETSPSVELKNLPTVDFLKQTVADAIVMAVTAAAAARPKYPGMSPAISAAVHIGVYLKVHNVDCTQPDETTVYEEVEKRMDIRHKIIKIATRNMMRMINPHVTILNKVPAFLNVTDIAGLVKGAAEGQGLGNAFLSHISACDAIFHLCRAFEDDDVTHIEGEVNPVRDLDIIGEELRLKDIEFLGVHLDKLEKLVVRGNDKKLKPEYDTVLKVKNILIEEKKHIRFADWSVNEIEILNKYLFLTSKPVIYLVNLSEKDYIRKKNKWLIKIKEWVDKNDPGAILIPFSGVFENKIFDMDDAERAKYFEENKVTSALDKIIVQGYKALQLQYFFTSGADEVKAWTIQKGTKAPQAAGRIHTDFEKGFIMAEVMKFDDFKNEGSENGVKAAGKYRQQGRNYVVEDGDIIFFKFNAGAGLKDPKKK